MRAKLLIVRPTLGYGGADRVTLTLLQAFDRNRFELGLALVHREGEYLEDVPRDVTIHSLNAPRVAASLAPFVRLLRRERPAILFSTASGTNALAILARTLSRVPCRVVLSERNVLLHGRSTYKKKLLLGLKRRLYTRADGITAVSEGVREDLVKQLGLAREQICVVGNPIVTDDLSELAQEPVADEWFQESTPVVLGAGRLVEEKDFATLLRAFAIVQRERAARLMILGEGPLRGELTQLVQELGLENAVRMPGFDKNPFKYMARCAAFVLSSRFEGLPGVLIQAMACGAPVISTDCPAGPSEIITPNVDGMLVPVGDTEKMSAAILQLLDERQRAEEMGKRARKSVERFRTELVVANYTRALLAER